MKGKCLSVLGLTFACLAASAPSAWSLEAGQRLRVPSRELRCEARPNDWGYLPRTAIYLVLAHPISGIAEFTQGPIAQSRCDAALSELTSGRQSVLFRVSAIDRSDAGAGGVYHFVTLRSGSVELIGHRYEPRGGN